MSLFLSLELLAFWLAWFYPYVVRAPKKQDRASIIARGPTLWGLLLEALGIGIAFTARLPNDVPRSTLRIVIASVCGPLAVILFWTAVTHLGRQFRITAGIYHDHQFVTTGPYAIVRHPIYTSLLAILLCTLAILDTFTLDFRLRWSSSFSEPKSACMPKISFCLRDSAKPLSTTGSPLRPIFPSCDSVLYVPAPARPRWWPPFRAAAAYSVRAQNLTEQYQATADKLIAAALADNEGYDRLTYLCYRIGARLSGSAALDKRRPMVRRTDESRGIEQCPRDPSQGAALGARRRIGAHASRRSTSRSICSDWA